MTHINASNVRRFHVLTKLDLCPSIYCLNHASYASYVPELSQCSIHILIKNKVGEFKKIHDRPSNVSITENKPHTDILTNFATFSIISRFTLWMIRMVIILWGFQQNCWCNVVSMPADGLHIVEISPFFPSTSPTSCGFIHFFLELFLHLLLFVYYWIHIAVYSWNE